MDNIIVIKSEDFALNIIRVYKELTENKKEFVMSKQLLRCGTSIGANVAEAQYAQSKPDFVSKMSIALKEANETRYWLNLLIKSRYLEDKTSSDKCAELIRILTSIINKSKENKE